MCTHARLISEIWWAVCVINIDCIYKRSLNTLFAAVAIQIKGGRRHQSIRAYYCFVGIMIALKRFSVVFYFKEAG